MRRDIKLESLEVAVQHNGVGSHIRYVSSGGRRAEQVRIDHDLLLREISNQHVVAVVEAIDVVQFDGLIPVADRVVIREGLQRQLAGSRWRTWPLAVGSGCWGSSAATVAPGAQWASYAQDLPPGKGDRSDPEERPRTAVERPRIRLRFGGGARWLDRWPHDWTGLPDQRIEH